MTTPEDNARDQLRRDLTRQINTTLRQLHNKEAWLAANKGADEASRIIASCEVAALRLQNELLQESLAGARLEPHSTHHVFSDGDHGCVQGTEMRAEDSEIRTARLIKAMQEAAWLVDFPLPWSWYFDRVPGSVMVSPLVTAMGRYVIMGGGFVTPRFVAYLSKAGALFPSLVREVIALRMALPYAPGKAAPYWSEADALIAQAMHGEGEKGAQSGSSG